MNYKYTLDNTSKKFKCPSCQEKKYVRYINNETTEYLDYKYGRCDRVNSCKYFKKPNFKLSYDINNNNKNNIYNSSNKPKISYHSLNDYENTINYNNSFITYLKTKFVTVDINHALQRFYLGTSHYFKNAIIFWQVDQENNLRAGKIMGYNKSSGKRIKKPIAQIGWMHHVLKLENFKLSQCLFGLHQINDFDNSRTICIVEAEKTAIVMSILQPNFIWMSTGSESAFKEDLLLPIKNRKIIACPDKGCFDKWQQQATTLNQQGYNIVVDNLLKQNNSVAMGCDLVDLLL